MKAAVYDMSGKKKYDIELPKIFDSKIREDIIAKSFEAERYWQPHSSFSDAGKRHSASGTISHKRHDWKGQYGKGISRTPRKALWRRGVQFNWVGAEVSNTRGGRLVHRPMGIRRVRKINEKEMEIAFSGAVAATAHGKYIVQRYARISKVEKHLPFVIESFDNVKAKKFLHGLKEMLGDLFEVALAKRTVRAGKGKLRGRKYKSNAGLLLIKGDNEKMKIPGIEIKSVSEVKVSNLYPLGRLAVYTEKALEELK
ncbi:MAG: 50S ribosomal protein L4 [Nanoarchaeota archaeon]